ncbi:tyrosine-type recombinase/integrase [Nocardioides jensenii]|uniref:tyrosine-type recombinase/integrase n=1 Tax=Nocardioides jensenii TaxID=1843 RepID=UPI00082F572F|nr:site-specific integrase [Nocardioides jensenii]
MGRPINPKVTTYERTDGTLTYRVRVRVDGRQSTETFDSEAAAQAFAIQCKDPKVGPARAIARRDREEKGSDAYIPTVAEMLETHLRQLTGIEQASRDGYRAEARRSWLPDLGPLRLDEVTRDEVADWVNAATGTVKPKTIKNALSVLSSLFETAIERGHVTANPARRIRISRDGEEDTDDIRFLTYAEFDILYAQFPEWYRPFVATLFGTGMRFGEITAQQKRDADLAAGHWDDDIFTEAPLIRVARAWKKGNRLGPPKSKKSRRPIWVDPVVVDAYEAQLKNKAASDLVFTTPSGLRITHANFYNRIWRPATIRASVCAEHMPKGCRCGTGKPHLCKVHTEKNEKRHHIPIEPCGCPGTLASRPRIHDARHTHASWLIAQGIRLEVIQERLGHEDYATTRRVYGHLLPDMQREAAQAAALAFARTALAANEDKPAKELTAPASTT